MKVCRLLLVLAALAFSSLVVAQPAFDKEFFPDSIGPGNATTLTFTIDNSGGGGVTDLAFTDNLPASVVVAAIPDVFTDCAGATITATPGSTTISMADGTVGPGASCTLSVNVTSSTAGTHMNVSGDLTSSAGNSGTATDDLEVDTARPSFSKSFSPSSVSFGGRSTLTFTVDNTANATAVSFMQFSDSLPTGVTIASPANATTDCGTAPLVPTLTASAGTSEILFQYNGNALFPAVAAGATCTIVVDVIATGVGLFNNISSDLTATVGINFGPAGKAVATLESTRDPLSIRKTFIADPVAPGGNVDLRFTVENFDRLNSATNITFTDDLDATLSGLVATGLPQMNVCGPGSVLSGTNLLSLTGANLPAESSCTFVVTLQIPAGATAGAYPNTTSTISGTVGGSPVVGAPATDLLFLSPAPTISKVFIDNPAAAGSTTELSFTITNTSSTFSATDVAFSDAFDVIFPTASVVPANGDCGAGSIFSFTPLVNPPGNNTIPAQLSLSGGTLAPAGMAGDSCTFSVTLDIAPNAASGTYPNATTEVTATVDGATRTGNSATDSIDIVGAPSLTKEFIDDPVIPGDTVTLQFELQHDETAPADATGISFTDDLNAVLAGLSAVGLPMNNVCGSGSQISGTTMLSFTGGILAPGESCAFSVTLQVPGAAMSGIYPNSTSSLDATVGGIMLSGTPATDDLIVSGLSLTKEFTDDPVIPGAQATLQFTLVNEPGAAAATGIIFSDSIQQTVNGATFDPASIPVTPCGAGSTIGLLSGNTFMQMVGGSLNGGEMCQFSILVNTPAAAVSGNYPNTTQSFIATIDGSAIALPNATDDLVLNSELIALSKTFLTNPVSAGATTSLEFTLSNTSLTETITGITFTDDLSAALSGLVATGLPMTNVCGMGSDISGTGLLSFTNGTLAPGASCTFNVTVQVPVAPAADLAVNTTSSVTGDASGLPVTGSAAMDTLFIRNLTFSKAFDGPTTATGTAILTFTIENVGASAVTGVGFVDDLNAVLPGLVATGLPVSGVCGASSSVSGTGLLTATGLEVPGMGICTFDVTVQVPGGAMAGTYPNTTSALQASGLVVADPATADLQIEPPPTFAKGFSPSIVTVNQQVSTLTFTIDNTASAVAASSLDFTDNLPSGMQVAAIPNASTTCTGGTLTATAGTAVITYTGGTVAAGATCIVSVDVLGTNAGMLVNTSGALTSTSGDSGTAMATLTVEAPPVFSKAFAPNPIALGAVSTLTFTVDNSASVRAATALGFSDNLPGGMTVAPTPNPATTCGGSVSATPASTFVSFSGGSVGIGLTCTVSVDVTADISGSLMNTSGALVSSSGTSNTASDTLVVNGVQVMPTSGLATTEAGGTATFMIVLETVPANDVTIDLMSDNTAEGTVMPASITFTPGNALMPRTITVTGVDDLVADGPIMYSIITSDTMSMDPAYNGIVVADVTATNSDNDTAGITVNGTVLMTDEFGMQDTYTVVLNTEPTTDVTITNVSGDTSEVIVDLAMLTFTTANWDTPQTVTVTGVSDMLDDGDQVVTIDVSASSMDPNYDVIDPTDVLVTNVDDQPPLAVDDNAMVLEEGTVLIDVLANDSDPDALDMITLTSVGTATNGTTALETGQARYTPNPGFVGNDSFGYTITDSLGKTASATVNVVVTNVNDPPVAMDDAFMVAQSGTVTGNVLNNDTDVDSVNLTVTLQLGPVNGSLILNPDGTFSYTQDGSANLSDSFTYEVCDDGVPPLCDTAIATFNVQADPPDLFVAINVEVNGAPVGPSARVGQNDAISVIADYGNSGNSDASGVVLTVNIPAGTQFNPSQSDAGWMCDTAAGTCTFAVGDVASGGNGSATITFVLVAPVGGLLSINAMIVDDGSAGADANPVDNASVFQLLGLGLGVPVGGLPMLVLLAMSLLYVGRRRLAPR